MSYVNRQEAIRQVARYVSFENARSAVDQAEKAPGYPYHVKILPGWGEGGLSVLCHGEGRYSLKVPVPDGERAEGWKNLEGRLRITAESLKTTREANEGSHAPGLGDVPESFVAAMHWLRAELVEFEGAMLRKEAEVWNG